MLEDSSNNQHKEPSTQPAAPPLAWIVTHDHLSGWPRRWLMVPAGHIGLVMRDGQLGDRLPPGRHAVVSWGDILWGRPSAVEVAVVKTESVSQPLSVEHLLAADGELADLWAQVVLRVADPERFYAAFLQQAWQVTPAGVLDVLVVEAGAKIADEVGNRGVADSASPHAQEALGRELLQALSGPAAARGVHLEGVQHATLRPAEDTVLRQRKLRQLEGQLRQVEIDASLDAAEQVARMREITSQMERDYQLPPGILVGALDEPLSVGAEEQGFQATVADQQASLLERARALQARAQEGLSQRLGRLLRSTEGDDAKEASEVAPPSPPEAWWMRWVKVLKWGGYLVYLVFIALAVFQPGSGENKWWLGLVYAVTGIPFALGMLLSALHLDRRAARHQELLRSQRPLMALSRGRLERADELVRRQLGTELSHLAGVVQEARQRVYGQGDKQVALRLGEVRRQADQLARKVQQPAQGTPAYLGQAALLWEQVEGILNSDEQLLRLAADASQTAHDLRQAALSDVADLAQDIANLESQLADIDQAFAARSRMSET